MSLADCSQGPEFRVPNDTEVDSLTTRELIYTAITRAKQSITIYGSPERWRVAIELSSARVSGMTEFLGIEQQRKPD